MNRREALRTLAAGSAAGALTAGAVAVASPSSTTAEPIGAELAALIARHRTALAAQEAAGLVQGAREMVARDHPDDAAARAAFEAADDAFNASCDREQDAHNAVIAVPILTLADMRAKAAYLASVARYIIHDGATMAALLASMGAKSETVSDLPPEPDPLLAVIGDYRRNMAVFNTSGELTSDEDDALADATWRPHYDALCTGQPAATSLPGAVAALRLAAGDMEGCQDTELVGGLVRAALAYFDGRA